MRNRPLPARQDRPRKANDHRHHWLRARSPRQFDPQQILCTQVGRRLYGRERSTRNGRHELRLFLLLHHDRHHHLGVPR